MSRGWALAALVVVLGCGKKRPPAPSGPTRAEVVAKHREAGHRQLQNLRAVADLALAERPRSLDEIAKMDERNPMGGIVLNDGNQTPRAGNSRVILLNELFEGTEEQLKALDFVARRNRLIALRLPLLPTDFLIDPHGKGLLRECAVLLAQNPLRDPGKTMWEGTAVDLEEFARLRYLLVLRTIAIVPPRHIRDKTWEVGHYAGQLMIFDLEKRSLEGVLPVAARNKAGTTTTGVNWDLSYEVRKEIRRLVGDFPQ